MRRGEKALVRSMSLHGGFVTRAGGDEGLPAQGDGNELLSRCPWDPQPATETEEVGRVWVGDKSLFIVSCADRFVGGGLVVMLLRLHTVTGQIWKIGSCGEPGWGANARGVGANVRGQGDGM